MDVSSGDVSISITSLVQLSMSLSYLLSRMQRYPKPKSADELDALIVLNTPAFKTLAKELVALPQENLAASCAEALDALSQPSSPYSVYIDSSGTWNVALPAKKSLCDQVREQGNERQLETVIHEISRMESVNITSSRPRVR